MIKEGHEILHIHDIKCLSLYICTINKKKIYQTESELQCTIRYTDLDQLCANVSFFHIHQLIFFSSIS